MADILQFIAKTRNLVDDDKDRTCSKGLHVGSSGYAGPNGWYHSAGDNVVIVKVNPRDAVSVPPIEGESEELILRAEELLQDFPMRSIVLALFHVAKETEDIADIYPSTIQVLKKTLDNSGE